MYEEIKKKQHGFASSSSKVMLERYLIPGGVPTTGRFSRLDDSDSSEQI